MKAVFKPKNEDTLRPELRALVGKTFTFVYAGTADDDEPYPGQDRWTFAREHDVELGELASYWMPQQDLEPL